MNTDEHSRNVSAKTVQNTVGHSDDAVAVRHPPPLFGEEDTQMDVISATASIAGILAIATKLVKVTYSLAQTGRQFRQDLTALGNEVSSLLGVLHTLKSSVLAHVDVSSPITSASISSSSSTSSSSFRSTPSESDKDYEVLSLGRTQTQLNRQILQEIDACQSTLIKADQLLSQFGPKPGQAVFNATKQLQWSLKKPDIQLLISKVEKHKTTLAVLLSSQGTFVPHASIESDISER